MSGRRILLTIPWLAFAGMEQQLMHLARGLATRGDAVTIACIASVVDPAELEDNGIRVVPLGGVSRRRRAAMLAPVTRLARTSDVVHCTGWDASAWGRVAAALARRPALMTEHTPGRETQTSLGGTPRARLIALHNRVLDSVTYASIAVAEPQVQLLIGEGVSADKIVVVPNGVPLGPIREAAADAPGREALGLPPEGRVVLHVARFEEQKRQAWTYEAVAALRRTCGDVHAVFAGDGTFRQELQRRAEAEGADWAHFLGVRDDVAALLSVADLAVLPSAAEALPMAMIEAMAVGVPQVATDVGDVGATLRDSGAGLVVDPDDPPGFVAACERVLRDPELAKEMRARAGHGAGAFAVETMVERYSRLFDAALAGIPPREALA